MSDSHPARELHRVSAPFHNICYYCPEARVFAERGIRGWWRAYFAHRSAPLGQAPLEVVQSAFYNFASRMIAKAIPSVWEAMTPAEALELRIEVVDRALRRVLGEDGVASAELREAAELSRRATEGCRVEGRVLFAGLAGLPWPTEAHLVLWHGMTLLREHRGDSHNLALAAAEVDGTACHLLMTANGHGNAATIQDIRGWTPEEWAAAEAGLVERGWLQPGGGFTDAGRAARQEIEHHTDRLAAEPALRLGERLERFLTLARPMVAAVHERGDVPGEWPPRHLVRDDAGGGSERRPDT